MKNFRNRKLDKISRITIKNNNTELRNFSDTELWYVSDSPGELVKNTHF